MMLTHQRHDPRYHGVVEPFRITAITLVNSAAAPMIRAVWQPPIAAELRPLAHAAILGPLLAPVSAEAWRSTPIEIVHKYRAAPWCIEVVQHDASFFQTRAVQRR